MAAAAFGYCGEEGGGGRSRVQFIVCFFLIQEMEKLASRKLRISARETMKIAEKLYIQGLVVCDVTAHHCDATARHCDAIVSFVDT